MSLFVSLRSEILKIRRTPSFWLTLAGALLIPLIFFLVYVFDNEASVKKMMFAPWAIHFAMGWQILSLFLFPMYIILICALLPQIEFKNNAWKQVFASPQSFGNIYFAKLITVHMMILFCYLMFIFFMIISAMGADLIHPEYRFIEQHIDWKGLMRLNGKMYLSILGLSSIQFWLSLRFKNFIAPVGIGLFILVAGTAANGLQWEHVYKIPHAYPFLSMMAMAKGQGKHILNHEWNSLIYFIVFTIIGFLDMKYRKEKG
jgi:lantibiotic transport system permease protein